jgi:hypothetical protein
MNSIKKIQRSASFTGCLPGMVFLFFVLNSFANILTVTNLNDTGAGSLRQAIADAASGDTINFAITGTITLTNGELLITKNLSIVGPGAATLAIDGNRAGRIVEIVSNSTVAVFGLTLTNGLALGTNGITDNVLGVGGPGGPAVGGAVLNQGTLILSSCKVAGNSALGGLGGAGVIGGGAGGIGGDALGGGIFNGGMLFITNTIFSGNSATGGGGGLTFRVYIANGAGGNGLGGAICNTNTIFANGCFFASDSAAGGAGGGPSIFYGVGGGSGGSAWGGAVCQMGPGTVAALFNSTLASNAAYGAVGVAGADGQGGYAGITAGGPGGKGGAGLGGAICSSNAVLNMTNVTLAANMSVAGAGGNGGNGGTAACACSCSPGAGGSGGDGGNGFGGGVAYFGGTASLVSLTCSGNSAGGAHAGFGGPGGGVYPVGICFGYAPGGGSGSDGSGQGGGLYRSFSGVTCGNCIFAGNIASNSGVDISGAVASAGHNLVGVQDGSSGWTGSDLMGSAGTPLLPGFYPLAADGGQTPTLALRSGSPAIDAGDDSLLAPPFNLNTDQRGLPRKKGNHVDIGAFELQPASLPVFICKVARLSNGVPQLCLTNNPGATFAVLSSSNVALSTTNWTFLGLMSETTSGQYQFTDVGVTNSVMRFYRIRSP